MRHHTEISLKGFHETPFCRVVSQLIVILLLMQSLPLATLSQRYHVEVYPERFQADLSRLKNLFTPAEAAAQTPPPLVGDLDGDCDVDRNDLMILLAARNTPASGPDDPRDLDKDGRITGLDARKLVIKCTLPRCAVLESSCPDATNLPPVAHAGADQTVFVQEVVALDASGSNDPEGDALTFFWRFVDRPAGSQAALDDPAVMTPVFQVDLPGSYQLALVVNDGELNSAEDRVTISTRNSPPVADAGSDQTVFVGEIATLDGSGSSDVDGDLLVFEWSLTEIPPGSGAVLSDPDAMMPIFLVDQAGNYRLRLIVNDGILDSEEDITIVATRNSAPVADAGPDQTVFVGDPVTLAGVGSSDADGDLLSVLWALTVVPPGSAAVLSDPTAMTPSFVADVPGEYVAQLLVNDGTVDSPPDTVIITTTNSAPVADAGPDQTVFVGDPVFLDGGGSSDADGDPLSVSWALIVKPVGSSTVLLNPTSLTPDFVADLPGEYVTQLIVNDGTVDSAPDTVKISTQNSPPVADAGPDQSVLVGTTVHLDGNGSRDADGDPLLASWALIAFPANSLASLSDPTVMTPSFVADLPGEYMLRLTVHDGIVESTSDLVVIMALPPAGLVPDLVGLNQSDAEAAILAANFIVGSISRAAGGEVLPGLVSAQSPLAGASLSEGNPIDFVIREEVLLENADFRTFLEFPITVPDVPSALKIGYADLVFDTGDDNIRDAFEVAFLDENQQSLVHPTGPDRDALFNVSEGGTPVAGQNTLLAEGMISVDLAHIPPGTEGTLVLRLINNDADTTTSVRISSLEIVAGGLGTPAGITPEAPDPIGNEVIDFASLSDVTPAFATLYRMTSFVRDPSALFADLQLLNAGTYAIDTPLLLVIDQISNPAVLVHESDGFTPTGLPYFSLSHLLAGGRLSPGESTEIRSLSFLNPDLTSFSYRLTVLGRINSGPRFTSEPLVEALADQAYNYDADAVDDDGDLLSYSLRSKPDGMTIDSTSGLIAWTPTAADMGSHSIDVHVADSRGGVSNQGFNLSVRDNVPNRPPLFTSTPVVDTKVGEAYLYAATATDPDADPLVFSIVSGPAGLQVSADGQLTWTPTADQIGQQAVVIDVSDGQGGVTQQSYTILVRQEEGNRPPLFVTLPSTSHNLPGLPNAPQGNVAPIAIDLNLLPNEVSIQDISITLPADADESAFADVVITVDQSGSMQGEIDWIPQMVLDLENALQARGIGPNRYALAGFGPDIGGDDAGGLTRMFALAEGAHYDLEVYGPDNRLIDISEFDAEANAPILQIQAPVDGDYTLIFHPEATTPLLELALDVIEKPVPLPVAQAGIGEIRSGTLSNHDLVSFTFDAPAGTFIYFDWLSDPLIGGVTANLHDPAGLPVVTSVRVGDEFGPIALPRSGTYTISLRSGIVVTDGDFAFRMLDAKTDALSFDTVITGRLDLNGIGMETDIFAFDGLAGQTVFFDAQGSELKGTWNLFGPDGQALNDGRRVRDDFEAELNLDGPHFLVLKGTDNAAPVNYQFEAFKHDNAPIPLNPGETVLGAISRKGESDTYAFSGTPGQQIYFDGLLADSTSIVVKLTSPTGDELFKVFSTGAIHIPVISDRGVFVLKETGAYHLTVTGAGETVGDYSFRLLDSALADPLLQNTVVNGVNAPRHRDIFSVSGIAGERLYFDRIAGGAGAQWSLIAPDGSIAVNSVAMSTIVASRSTDFDYTPTVSGPHLLAIENTRSASAIDYRIQVLTPVTTTQGIVYGNTITDTFSEPGERRIYTFDVALGDLIYFDGIQADSGRMRASLFSPTGESLFKNVAVNQDTGPVLALEAGAYQLIVEDNDSGGNFSFRVLNGRNAPVLTIASQMTGMLNPGMTDLHRINGMAGERLQFDRISGGSGGTWLLFQPDGTLTLGRTRPLTTDFERDIQEDGVHLLVLRNDRSDLSVDFDFQVNDISEAPIAPSGFGVLLAGTLAPSEVREFHFDAPAGTLLYIDMLVLETGIRGAVLNPAGRFIIPVHASDTGPFYLSASGTYTLSLENSSSTTSKEFSLRLLSGAEALPLPLDTRISGTINPGKATELFSFNGTVGQRLLVNHLNDGDNGFWNLFDPKGIKLLRSNVNLKTDFVVTLKTGGIHTLVLEGRDDTNVINYDFEVVTSPLTTTAIALGDRVTKAVAEAGQVDVYTFNAAVGQVVLYDGLATPSTSYRVSMIAPEGDVLFENRQVDDDMGPLTLDQTGVYTIKVVANDGTLGDYGFQILDAEATPLVFGGNFSGTLDPGTASRLFSFEGHTGERIFIDVLTMNGSASFSIFGPDGRFIRNIGGGRASVLNRDGLHILVLDGRDINNPVVFDFDAFRSSSPPVPLVFGAKVDQSISILGEQDIYTFEGTAGQQIFFDGIFNDPAIEADLFTPGGENLLPFTVAGDQRKGPFVLREDGTYRVIIHAGGFTGLGDVTGAYRFRVLNFDAAPFVTDESNLAGTFEDAEGVLTFNVAASAGQLIRVGNSDAFWGTAEQISTLASTLRADQGGLEDGYEVIRVGLGLEFRPGAAVNMLLITDEDRDNGNRDLSFGSMLAALQAQNALLNVVVLAGLSDGDGNRALSIDSKDNAFLPDGTGGFTRSAGATAINVRHPNPRVGTITPVEDYIDLALATGGAAHDLRQLRAGGLPAQSFAAAFTEIKTDEILNQLGLDVITADSDAPFSNLTGVLPGIGGNDTGNFQVKFTGDGVARSFDLLFIRSNTGSIVGSIPVTMNSDYLYLARAVDPDGDNLNYSLPLAPAGATIDPLSGRVTFKPTRTGAFDFTLEVKDGRGGMDRQSFTVNAVTAAPNLNPSIISTPVRQAVIDRSYRYPVTATDPDGDGLLYFLNKAPAGMRIDLRDGTISWTPLPAQVGDQEVEVRVLDGHGGEATQGFIITVVPDTSNTPPRFETSPPSDAAPGLLYRYQAQASDADGDALSFDLPLAPAGMTVDPSSGAVIWSPDADQEGVHAVILRVDDGHRGITLQSYEIHVVGPNSVPVILSTPPLDAGLGLPYLYPVRANDAEDDPLAFRLLTAPAGMEIDAVSGRLTWTPAAGDGGIRSVEIEVSDGRGGLATQAFELTVTPDPDNDSPVITSIPRDHIALGRSWYYRLAAIDPNADPLEFHMDLVPNGMSVDPDSGLIVWTPTADQFGVHPVQLRVTDGRGGAAVQAFSIDVRSEQTNTAPQILSTPPTSATVDLSYRYRVVAEDADGDPISFELLSAPEGMSIDPLRGEIRWTPTLDQIGLAEVMILVLGAQGGETTQSFTIETRGTNLAPVISSIPPTGAAVGQPYAYPLEASDPEGRALAYALNRAPTGMTIDAATGLIAWTPLETDQGNHPIEVAVSDGEGGVAVQPYTLHVGLAQQNNPAIITSTPVFPANVGDRYEYDVDATDPEGDALTFSLEIAPNGMTINGITGLIAFTPTAIQVGPHGVRVHVTDTAGNISFQAYTVTVVQDNLAPQITSAPLETAAAGLPYSYDVQATDPDGDPLHFALTESPVDMTIDEAGRVRWTPQLADTGLHPVVIAVSDPLGASARQSFNLPVLADAQAPVVSLTLSDNPITVEESATLTVQASDDVRVETLDVTFNGVPLALDGNGQATLRPATLGNFEIVVRATDNAGNVSIANETLSVNESGDPEAPFVFIKTPLPGTTIKTFTDVIGTVRDDNLDFYSLSIAPLQGGDFREIARGTAPVIDALLGKFDPTVLANGAYRLRLTAQDTGLLISTDEIVVDVAGNLKLGNFTISFSDLEISLSGIPISVIRTYDSLNAAQRGDFGFGWRLEFKDFDLRTTLPDPSQVGDTLFEPFVPGTRVYVTMPGGKREGHTFQAVPFCKLCGFLGIFKPTFVADAGVTNTLSVDPVQLRFNDATGEFQSYVGLIPYNPASPIFGGTYRVTTKEGLAYRVDGVTGDVRTVSDQNEVTLTFDETGISSSLGVRVDFERDAAGRITAMIDPTGKRIAYSYDANGDLVSVTDRNGNTTALSYNTDHAHFLEEIIDPLGRTGVRTEYDEDGRMVRLINAGGNAIALTYDIENALQTVTDRLGNATTFEYDPRGNIVTEIDSRGGITRRVYDENDNVTSLTDPLGNTTSGVNDENGNPLSITDALGNVSTRTYNTSSRLLTETDRLGNTTRHSYDSKGNRTSTTDALGHTTTFALDSTGNVLSKTDALGNTKRFAYNGRGDKMSETDPLGNLTTFTYDGNGNALSNTSRLTTPGGVRTLTTSMTYDNEGRLLSLRDAEGDLTVHEYDALGNRLTTIDALGRRTEVSYDGENNVIRKTLGGGLSRQFAYDAEGRRTQITDALGRVTRIIYDAAEQIIGTVFPDNTPENADDNPRKTYEYDLAGNRTAELDESGNRTETAYNALHLRSLLRDALGRETAFAYDVQGNLIRQTDPLGRSTAFSYDALNRLIETSFPDDTTTTTSYDALGRKTSNTDQAGRATRFEYDAPGNLTAVIDAASQRTEFEYDEAGNRILQRDANGNVTRFEYDGLGHRTAIVRPEGQRSTMTYDALGNLLSETDFNGETTTFEYDFRDQQTAKRFSDGSSTTTSYTASGKAEAVTDARGVTRFAYDARDRLVRRVDPESRAIEYTYDSTGNVLTRKVPSATVTYTFDVLNRIASATDPGSGVTRYFYDEMGNTTRTERPNSTIETRQYDALNRLTLVATEDLSGNALTGFQYGLSPTGLRASLTELNGRQVVYAYDALDRLIREEIADPTNGDRTIAYTYDPVGNRLSRNDSVDGLTTYLYDHNDRLLDETSTGSTTTYAYDANGNTLSKGVDVDHRSTYVWDFENRLTEAQVTEAGISTNASYAYDAGGTRVAETVGGVRTRFMVDANRPFVQVLEEVANDDSVKTFYVYGRDLISQKRNGGQSFYETDAIGSTRALSDATGAISDTYDYDAYGRILQKTGATENNYLYTGEQRDRVTGLTYLRARYLDTRIGRFVTTDPFDGVQREPLSLHRYLYANASPTHFIDPGGRFSMVEINIVIGIIGKIQDITGYVRNVAESIGRVNRGFNFIRTGRATKNVALEMIALNIPAGIETWNIGGEIQRRGVKELLKGVEIGLALLTKRFKKSVNKGKKAISKAVISEQNLARRDFFFELKDYVSSVEDFVSDPDEKGSFDITKKAINLIKKAGKKGGL